MSEQVLYQGSLLLLLVIGFVPASVFISQHRPRQWRRLAAWDASGLVVILAAIYLRNIILLITRWPGSTPRGWGDTVFALASLLLIDVFLVLRLISFRSFVQRDARTRVTTSRKTCDCAGVHGDDEPDA